MINITEITIEEISNGFIFSSSASSTQYFEKIDDVLNHIGNFYEHGNATECDPDPEPEK